MLNLFAILVRQRVVVLSRPGERFRLHVVQAGHGVAPAIWQARIARNGEAELIEVRRGQCQVVDHAEVAEPPAKIPDIDRHTRQDLVLHAGGKLPVVAAVAPAGQQIFIERGARNRFAEILVGHQAAQVAAARTIILQRRVRHIAVRLVVAVRVGPGSVRHVDEGVERVGILPERVQRLALQILVERQLDGGFSRPEDIPRCGRPVRDVLPRQVVLRREDDVPVWHERAWPDDLFGEARVERVEPEPAAERPPIERPPVLGEQTEIVVLVGLQRVRRRPDRNLVRYAVVEPVRHGLEVVALHP